MGKKLILTYGRFQPVHIGHHKIFAYMWSKFIGEGFNGINYDDTGYDNALVFLSASFDNKKNPLTFEERLSMIKKNAIGFSKSLGVYDKPIKDIIHLGKELDGQYDELYFVLGSDRSGSTMFDRFVEYNGKEYKFDKIECHSIPRESLENKEATFIESSSGSNARTAILNDNKELFFAYVGGENEVNNKIYNIIKNKIC